MALFDALINDVASRFGLGANAAPLVREVVNLVVGSPGGVSGFFETLKSAGLGSEVASWLGRTDAPALPTQQLERVVGSSVLGGIASKLGLGGSAVSTAIGYILPKVIGALTPGGVVPTSIPSEITRFVSPAAAPRAAEQVAPRRINVVPDKPAPTRWLWPALAAAALIGLGSWYLSSRSHAPLPVTPVAQREPVVPPAPAVPPRLDINNDNGTIRYSGAVHDEATRTSITDALRAVFGADHIRGDIGIDPNRGSAPWLTNLRAALENFKLPGVHAVFDGNSFNLGGVAGADRDRIINAVKGLFGGLSIGALADKAMGLGNTAGEKAAALGDKFSDMVSNANLKFATSLTSLKAGFEANDLVNVLNQSIVNFATGDSVVPPANYDASAKRRRPVQAAGAGHRDRDCRVHRQHRRCSGECAAVAATRRRGSQRIDPRRR